MEESGGNALNTHIEEYTVKRNQGGKEIVIKGPCIVYIATMELSTGVSGTTTNTFSCHMILEVDGEKVIDSGFGSGQGGVTKFGFSYNPGYNTGSAGTYQRYGFKTEQVPIKVNSYVKLSMSEIGSGAPSPAWGRLRLVYETV